ncbi:KR domain-containing protein [Saccharopolyspora sp. NFXS83]|uniref:KR domain-containing protein n=1 Tax=Saccharopolyspora sp. NFXS83 TaxID=2993560 RepID=UPI00224A4CE7|nr:KR domain-containing protein [Saccharopolyspora sp. NFXS83]MCX2730603.1 KR domain-containing protein [Saccharopolyspora sp. NFXS83]
MKAAHRPAVRPHLSAWAEEDFDGALRRVVWRPEPQPLPPGEAHEVRQVLLLGSDQELVRATAARLAELGISAVTGGADTDGIIDLNPLGGPGEDSADWRAPLRRTIQALHQVHDEWAAESRCGRHFYLPVTALGGLLGEPGGDRISGPFGGVWAGLAKGLQYELPSVATKIVDVDTATASSADRLGDILRREIGSWDHLEVGWFRDERYALVARPEAPGPQALHLGPDDTVLITGGSRGIGFLIAEGLAERTGCRVVVTGRDDPTAEHPAALLDDDEFARWRWAELKDNGRTEPVSEIRARLARAERLREGHRNLRRAAAAGLRIEHVRCDCTDPEQVRGLLAGLAAQPTVLIHNAGVDQSRRFAEQSFDDIASTIAVKVDGLRTVLDQLRGHPDSKLRLVSGVGSLSGRLGGMVGQVAYSAGNDGLARLGRWIEQETGLPAQTTIWHSWGGPGGMVNPRTALRYTSLVDPEEGVAHWVREILTGAAGEVALLGRYGNAVLPTQLPRLAAAFGTSDHSRWASARHYLGDVRSFRIHDGVECDSTFVAGSHPCLGECTVDGRPALPVSVVLEHAIALGDWIAPHGWPSLHLREVRDLDVALGALAFDGDRYVLRKSAQGRADPGGGWNVEVRLRRGDDPVLSATLHYGESPALIDGPVEPGEAGTAAQPVREGRFSWHRRLFPRPARFDLAGGGRQVLLSGTTPAELWALPAGPEVTVDPAALEEITCDALAEVPSAARLEVSRLVLAPGAAAADRLVRPARDDRWFGLTADGDAVLLAEGVRASS